MKIERLEIENFKRINRANLELSQVNYLVGGNNAGKSSILQAVHMAVSCAKLSVERGEAVIPESDIRYSPTSEFTLLGHTAPYENKKDGSRGRIEFFGRTADDAIASYRIELYKGRNYGNIGVERSGVYNGFGQIIVDPKNLFSVYVPGISGIPHREEYKSYASVFQKVAGGDANLVFRNVIRLLQERGLLQKVEELMNELVGQFSVRLNHKPETDTYLRVEASLSGSRYVPLDLIGTGVLQILQIVSYVALFNPVFLLVDEPDNHLHPSRQALLSKAFNKISIDYGATVVVSTHSRHLVSSATADAKIIWMKDGGVESDNCRDLATVLMDLGALDQLDSRGAECVICTEDRGNEIIENIVFNLNLSDRVKVITYNGISNAASSVAIKAMCDLLPNPPKLIVHRDRDFLTDDELSKWSEEYTRRGMVIFSPPLCDLEAYHCTSEHIATIYGVTNEVAAAVLDQVIDDKKSQMREKFRSKRQEANLKFWRDGGGPATDSIWPEGGAVVFSNLYGKDLIRALNERLPKEFGGRKNLLSTPSVEYQEELRRKLFDLGLH